VDNNLFQSPISIKKEKKNTKRWKKKKTKKKAKTTTEMKPIGEINTQFSNTDDEQKFKIRTYKVKTFIDLKHMVESSEDEKQD
jgi:hypothetical protein